MVASILARARMMPGFSIRRAMSVSLKRAIFAGSKWLKAARKASRLRRTVIQESPAWKPSSMRSSQSARLLDTGTPHSMVVVSRDRAGRIADQWQRVFLVWWRESFVTDNGSKLLRILGGGITHRQTDSKFDVGGYERRPSSYMCFASRWRLRTDPGRFVCLSSLRSIAESTDDRSRSQVAWLARSRIRRSAYVRILCLTGKTAGRTSEPRPRARRPRMWPPRLIAQCTRSVSRQTWIRFAGELRRCR